MKAYKHQQTEFDAHKDTPLRALWWEQGTGKTKTVIDTLFHLWNTGKVEALLVVAPGGVEANWVNDELPTHWQGGPLKTHVWSTAKKGTQAHANSVASLFGLEKLETLKVLAISYSALMTDEGAKTVRKFLDTFNCLYVADETTRIKTPGAKITKRVLASAKYASFRRTLNGTPTEDDPFHLYSQVQFTDPNAWSSIGVHNFAQFKVFFGVWEKITRKDGREFPNLIRYQNLDLLNKVMHQVGSRVLKKDVLDLPPKIYTKRHFELSAKQRKLYEELKSDFLAFLVDNQEVTAELAIVRLTRFQQICSGYIKVDGGEDLLPLEEKNPRLQCLLEALEDVSGSAIIWGKYDIDIDVIARALEARGEKFVTYDGRTSQEQREINKHLFQNGDARFFVAKPSAAGRGLTLTRADTVIYYNNSFSGDDRAQSEDRAHRIGQTKAVRYIDIVATGTVDEHILAVLRDKRKMSSIVTGDELKSWI